MISLKILPILRARRIIGPFPKGTEMFAVLSKSIIKVRDTIVKSKMFQESEKYRVLSATSLMMASRVNMVIKMKFIISVT